MMSVIKKEVQAHGLLWERQLLTRVYGATAEEVAAIPYTSPYDLPAALNRVNGANLSIKTSGSNTICMGDALRIFDEVSSKKPVHLIVVRYAQETATTKRVKVITEVDITGSTDALFGSATRADVEALDRIVKAVPQQRKPTPEEHAAIYALHKSLKGRLGSIYLNVKCNSQQSRLQCSFNKWDAFLAAHPERIVASSLSSAASAASLHGGTIDETLESAPRKFG